MNRVVLLAIAFVTSTQAFSIIVRHDIADNEFINRGKQYAQICHFDMGEGTLITERWILTAGHVGTDLERLLKNGRSPEMVCNGSKYLVDAVVVHPSFRNLQNGLSNDIALVRIKGSVSGVTPVRIYTQGDEIGKPIVLVGRGDHGTGLTGPVHWDKITRAASNKVDAVDATWISFDFDSPESNGITSYEGISGPGDSGGPALVELNGILYIAGISSFQMGQDKYGKGRYGVTEYYSRVSSFAEWILRTVENFKSDELIVVDETVQQESDTLVEYTGTYGFRRIIVVKGNLFFQREAEPLIPMKPIEKDLFLWDDGNTKLKFIRDPRQKIIGLQIIRRNGEVVNADKNQ